MPLNIIALINILTQFPYKSQQFLVLLVNTVLILPFFVLVHLLMQSKCLRGITLLEADRTLPLDGMVAEDMFNHIIRAFIVNWASRTVPGLEIINKYIVKDCN